MGKQCHFIFAGSKITADGDCSHEIKRHLLLGRKVMTNLDSIFKSRDITLSKNGPSSQGYGFSSSIPCPGYYKQSCDDHWGTRFSFNSGFLGVYSQQWDCWVVLACLTFNFLRYPNLLLRSSLPFFFF